MTEREWDLLLDRVEIGKCTPFLGAGANSGLLPLGGQIASEWAREWHYPLNDHWDLPRVAQFIAIESRDQMKPKDDIIKRLTGASLPSPADPDRRLNCLRTLASLPLPIYLTTNYDDLLIQALVHTGKVPQRELCRWNSVLRRKLGPFQLSPPVPERPLVFHLHGHNGERQSLVLTEDDYLDFLINVSPNDKKVVPPRIQEAMADSSLLFIGYSLRDINFRVLFRALVQSLEISQRSLSIAVQIDPADHAGDPEAAKAYLDRYFSAWDLYVHWATAESFANSLSERWIKRSADRIF